MYIIYKYADAENTIDWVCVYILVYDKLQF